MRKNYKKLTAVALTAAMTLGCTMTAFAANAASGDVTGSATGDGSYEGAEIEYPTVSVTLPTQSLANYVDYIVDPNDLITSTLNASGDAINSKYDGYTFNSDTGVYFKTTDASGDVKGEYTEKSKPITVTNKSAQDIKLTVKVTQTGGNASGDVVYSDKATFESTDTAKKLYLAVTDGTTTEALNASGDATFTANVSGKPDNFSPKHASGKYSYEEKSDASGWATVDYQLTGAVNKNATWGEGISFPNVAMTWSWEDAGVKKDAAPSVTPASSKMTAGQPVEVTVNLGRGTLAANSVSKVMFNGSAWTAGKHYSIAGNKITITSATVDYLLGTADTSWKATVVFDNGKEADITLTK